MMISHFIFTRGLAGAGRCALNTVKILIKRNIPAQLILIFDQRFASDAEKERFLEECAFNEVPTVTLEIQKRFSWDIYKRINSILQESSIVHSRGYKSDFYLLMAHFINYLFKKNKLKNKRKLITTQHGFSNGGPRSSFLHHSGNVLKLFYHHVIVVSQELKDRFLIHKYHRRCQVLKNFTPLHSLSQNEREKRKDKFCQTYGLNIGGIERKTIGWMGRLDWVKGPDLFFKALQEFSQVSSSSNFIKEIDVLIGGVGPLESIIPQKSIKFLTSQTCQINFHYLGAIKETIDFFTCLDFFVLSSRQEGTPMVLLEATACGIPYIAPRIGGIKEMTAHENHQWLFPKEDVSALRTLIDQLLLLEESDLHKMAALNKNILRRDYSEKNYLRHLLPLYFDHDHGHS